MSAENTRRLEHETIAASTFWEVSTAGKEVTTRGGKAGTGGRAVTRKFVTAARAAEAAAALVARKLSEGYAEPGRSLLRPRPGRPIDPKVTRAVRTAWKRIETWLATNAPPLGGRLGKPATPAAVLRAEQRMGVELPDAMRASYLVHDGGGDVSLFPYCWSMTLGGVVFKRRFWTDHLAAGRCGENTSEPDGPIRPVHYHPRWIPVGHSGGGDFVFVDLAPEAGGTVGQVIEWSRDFGPERVVALDMAEYLAAVADAMEAGAARFYNEPHVDDPSLKPGIWRGLEWPAGRRLIRPSGRKARPTEGPAAEEPEPFPVKRYFERRSGLVSTFWEVFRGGDRVVTNWGRIGGEGRPKLRRYASAQTAEAAVATAVAEKVAAGYLERELKTWPLGSSDQ